MTSRDDSYTRVLLRRWVTGKLLGDRTLNELIRDGYITQIDIDGRTEHRLTVKGRDLLQKGN